MYKAFDLITCTVGEHDLRLVLLAAAICYLSSLTAVELFRRARSTDENPTRWILMGGVAGGCGTWATHFIAMLAYTPHIPLGYDIPLTLLSMVVAVVMTSLALAVAVEDAIRWRAILGGALLGLGVGAMHYSGMAALQIPGRIEWTWGLVLLSIVAGTALSICAVLVARKGETGRILIAAAALLTLAIVVLHFSGMAALHVRPDPTRMINAFAFSPQMLGIAVAGVSVAILGIGLVTAFADRRLSGQARVFDAEIDKLKQSADWLSHHDVLTGLPNRAAFDEYLAAAIERADNRQEPFVLLAIDLDRFKEVNDLLGHSAGDQLLQRLTQIFIGVADGAFLARIGGDEFNLVVTKGYMPDAAIQTAGRLVASMANPFEINGKQIAVGLSVGGAIYPDDGSAATIRASAEAALQTAKAAGRGKFCLFDRVLGARMHERHLLKQDLGRAMQRGELSVHYQPQAARSGEVVGFEALLRWTRPKHGPVAPGVFIPIAEECGLIIPIGEWVLREACREAASWRSPLRIAVNLSPAQFCQDDLPEVVLATLIETGLAPHRLELEITEGVLVDNVHYATAILRRLKSLGVAIAIDDFGTGYSSLSYLQSFPFDRIKIDQSFISRLTRNEQSDTIVRGIINLGHGLGLSVIAEGVETQAQFDCLIAEGCDELQGFLVGRPAPIAAFDVTVARGQDDHGDALAFEPGEKIEKLRAAG